MKTHFSYQEYFNNLNEEAEISVDQALDKNTKKILKDIFEKKYTGIDKISFKKDGTIVAKKSYFYKHNETAQSVSAKLASVLNDNGIKIEIVEYYDDWKPWPKDSNFVVIFKIKKINEMKTYLEFINEAKSKYPELDKIVKDISKIVETEINKRTEKVESKMPYKAQYVLEELIKILEESV